MAQLTDLSSNIEYVDTDALADRLGITPQAIGKLRKRGVFSPTSRNTWDLWQSIALYCDHLRSMARGRPEDKSSGNALDPKTRLTTAQARYAEIKSDIAEKNLLSALEVKTVWLRGVQSIREGVLAIPPRLVIAKVISPGQQGALDKEIRATLGNIADAGSGFMGGGDTDYPPTDEAEL